jgi:hypothetical protein
MGAFNTGFDTGNLHRPTSGGKWLLMLLASATPRASSNPSNAAGGASPAFFANATAFTAPSSPAASGRADIACCVNFKQLYSHPCLFSETASYDAYTKGAVTKAHITQCGGVETYRY